MTLKTNVSQSYNQSVHVDIELDAADLKTSGPRLACLVKSDWINKKLSFKELTDGLSNQMLAMFPPSYDEQALIIRTYGKNSDLIVDRQAEIRNMVKLSQYDMANEVLATFNNGFLYALVPGDQIDVDDGKIDSPLAAKLAAFHSVPSDDGNNEKKSRLTEKLDHYVHLLNGTNSQLRHRLEAMEPSATGMLDAIKTTVGLQSSPPSLDSLESFFEYSFAQLDDDLHQIKSTLKQKWSDIPVVLCHNDTLSRNFLFDKQTNTMHMIDFEHSFDNLYLYDIENYFVEFAGLSSSPDWSKKYPSRERRLNFISEYVKHADFLHKKPGADELEKLCDRCHCLLPLTHLYWALWAVLEAMLNPEALSEFDYVNYAKNRFTQYKLHKNEFFAS
ncbi:unnamed protein product [Adineta ricciae]|uniref:ethanolamine kinase n=1 Tax=Adineta ricciae TaxID=249248 RepID=A0A815UEM7_ADIRI|nr:unnamed protein product [Adineta ricciae]CAF1515951.1 unnamed protein product [Adineta ricciae]